MGLLGQIINCSSLKLAVYGQIVLGAVTIVLLYLICLKLLNSEALALCLSGFLGLNFQILNYQATVLTESLATTLLMAVLYVHITSINERITAKRFFVLASVDSLFVMVRPNFILLPASLYALHVLYILAVSKSKGERLNTAASGLWVIVLGISFNLTLVAIWSTLYYLKTGQLGLSRTAEFNLLGKNIQYGYLDQERADAPPLARRVREIYQELQHDQDPYSIIKRLGDEDLFSRENLAAINSYFITGRRADFAIKTMQLFPVVLKKDVHFYYGKPNGSIENPLLHFINQGFNAFNAFNVKAFVFASGLAVWLLVKKKQQQFMILIMILATIFYHLLTITAFGYSEYPRLRVPIDLLLNVLVVLPLCVLALYADALLKQRLAETPARTA